MRLFDEMQKDWLLFHLVEAHFLTDNLTMNFIISSALFLPQGDALGCKEMQFCV